MGIDPSGRSNARTAIAGRLRLRYRSIFIDNYNWRPRRDNTPSELTGRSIEATMLCIGYILFLLFFDFVLCALLKSLLAH
jgi:hypothetical protein